MAACLRFAAALCLAAALQPLAQARAEHDKGEKPKWEIGLAGGAGWSHHYPGADQGSAAVAAVPFLIYRTEHVSLGEGGLVTGRVLETDRVEITASIRGSLPAHSEDNRAREGMPDLDTLVEIGPQVVINLRERTDVDSLALKLPLRAVLSTDFSNLKYRGLVFQPRLSYSRNGLLDSKFDGSVSVGPIFATDKLMDFFYDVPPQFATPTRPEYEARGGYMGTDLSVGLTYPFSDHFKVLLGGEVSYLGGNANEGSPLFRERINYRAALGFVWKIFVSKSTVSY